MSNVPNSWAIKKVDDYTEIITDYVANGSFASLKENVEYVDYSDYVLIRLADYNSNFNGEFRYITKNSYDFLSKTKLYGGEIIISNVGANAGTVFKAPILDKKMSLGPNSITLKTFGNDDFYYYWFKSIYGQHALGTIITGSAQPKFNKTNFRDLLIPVPPIEEQDAIVKVIKVFDNKIENNNAIIANLEEQAQAIFKSWFVDFEPFQDGEFVESELGLIPKDFSVVKLKEISTRRNGYSYKSKELNELSDTNMITLKNFNRNGGINFNATKPIDETERMKDFHYLNSGDILIACTDLTQNAEVLGRTISYLKNEEFDREVYSMDLVKIEPDRIEDKMYIYYYLSSFVFKSFAEGVATGTTVLHFPKKSIDEFKMMYPSSELINKFSNLIKPILLKQNNLTLENKKLEEIRDTLLPKLMSGEIRVEEAVEVE